MQVEEEIPECKFKKLKQNASSTIRLKSVQKVETIDNLRPYEATLTPPPRGGWVSSENFGLKRFLAFMFGLKLQKAVWDLSD